MFRNLAITVNQAIWPTTRSPGFPASFTAGSTTHSVPILQTLLLIGRLTTPPLQRGVSLSEFWACVRYLYAISPDPYLRLTTEFANLDSHQKTILSDDFGMGFSVGYLIRALDLTAWRDGRYYMERMGGW